MCGYDALPNFKSTEECFSTANTQRHCELLWQTGTDSSDFEDSDFLQPTLDTGCTYLHSDTHIDMHSSTPDEAFELLSDITPTDSILISENSKTKDEAVVGRQDIVFSTCYTSDDQQTNNTLQAYLPKLDSGIERAAIHSIHSGSLMPLVKQELKIKIQCKRLSRGESELFLEPEAPRQYTLTPDEIHKRKIRQEQNRRSALKAKEESHKFTRKLLQEIHSETHRRKRLTDVIDDLKLQRDRLKTSLDSHMRICTNTDRIVTKMTSNDASR